MDGLHIHHHNYCVIICCPFCLCGDEIEEAFKVLEKVKKKWAAGGEEGNYRVFYGKKELGVSALFISDMNLTNKYN